MKNERKREKKEYFHIIIIMAPLGICYLHIFLKIIGYEKYLKYGNK